VRVALTMGPPPSLAEQFVQNYMAISNFCVAQGLKEAARNCLTKLMSGALW